LIEEQMEPLDSACFCSDVIVMEQRRDIRDEADIKVFVDAFYAKVNADELLSPVFNEVARVDWTEHLPLLYSFWSALLFRTSTFTGRPFPKHLVLPIGREHFGRWVSLFVATIDELFEGAKAEEAKNFARSIADTFQLRMGLLGQEESIKFTR
jgi:hemoglobin